MLSVICCAGCNLLLQRKSHKGFQAIQLSSTIPLTAMTGHTEILNDTLCMFFYDEYQIYRKLLGSTRVSNDSIILLTQPDNDTKPAYLYYVFDSKSMYGYKFISADDTVPVRQLKDSFLILNAFSQFNFQPKPNYILANQQKMDGHTTRLVYTINTKPDESYADSFMLHYQDNFPNVPHSLSRSVDTIKNRKLTKIEMIYKATSFAGNNIPGRTFRFELLKAPDSDSVGIHQLLLTYKEIQGF